MPTGELKELILLETSLNHKPDQCHVLVATRTWPSLSRYQLGLWCAKCHHCWDTGLQFRPPQIRSSPELLVHTACDCWKATETTAHSFQVEMLPHHCPSCEKRGSMLT